LTLCSFLNIYYELKTVKSIKNMFFEISKNPANYKKILRQTKFVGKFD
jgi:hypothetical protein